MALNTNIGSAWISITSDTRSIVPSVTKAMEQAEKSISGEGIGKKLASGIGKTLTVGVATVGVAAGGVLAASLTKGLGRLTGIENAQAKLSGLGHEAQGVASIMDDALASVKGTAFGLEDAATVAASAVAAGVKPGDDLQRTLKLTGDAATIAGVGMGEMGAIFNKVAASNKMQMDVANQLMDAGIPIMQMVAEQMGVTAEEATKMASDGKISFEIFQKALEEGLGGAALKSGETVQGAFANMGAAAGRFGAKLADPAFQAAPAIFTALGGVFDSVNDAITPATDKIGNILTPALEGLATTIETRVAPWMGEMAGKAGDLAAMGLGKILDPASWTHVVDIFGTVRDTVVELWPSIKSLAGSFLTITQNISVATWDALAAALNAAAPLIESVLVPMIEKVAEFTEQNPETVEKMVWAFLAFKGVGAVAGPVKTFTGTLMNLGGAVKGINAATKGGGVANFILNLSGQAKSANPILAKLGGVASVVVQAFWKFGPALAKVGGVLLTAIRFVNPWVAGITAVVGALTWFLTKTELGQEITENVTEAIATSWGWVKDRFGEAIDWITGKFEAFTGWLSTAWNGIKSLFQGDFTGDLANAFGISDDNLIVVFFFTARDAIVQAGEVITNVFDRIWQAIQVTIGVIGTIVLTPFILLWNYWSWVIRNTWESIIKPVWDGISAGAQAMWVNYIQPALTAIALGWQIMADKIALVWEAIKTVVFLAWQSAVDTLRAHWDIATAAISSAWQSVSIFFSAVWQTIKTMVFDAWNWYVGQVKANWDLVTVALSSAWQIVSDRFTAIWAWIRDNVFQPMMNKISELWNTYASPIFQWVGDKWNWLRDVFVAGWEWIRDNAIAKFETGLSNLQTFVGNIVEGIKNVWNGLKRHLAEPINFMIESVWNNGVLAAWSKMREILPALKEGTRVEPITGYAAGGQIQKDPTGRISGPGTGTSDSILARIANGEHMWTAKEVRQAGGHDVIYAMRELIANKRPFSFDGNGGLVGIRKDLDLDAGDLAGMAPELLIPGFKDGGEIKPMWETQLARAHAWAQSRHGRPYVFGGSANGAGGTDCSGFMSGIANIIQGGDGSRSWATMAFNGGGNQQADSGPQGFIRGLGKYFSIGVSNGGPGGGHTAGTLGAAPGYSTTNVESGGSPSMVKYGVGAVGADHGQFPTKYHLPIGPDGAFVSGGAGGGFFDFLGGIKSWASEMFGKILDPIKDKLPSPPPEWLGIPGGVFNAGKDALGKQATEIFDNLGDLTSAVWSRIGEISLFDTGGILQSGGMALNLSGKPERVLPPALTVSFDKFVQSMPQLAQHIENASALFAQAAGELQEPLRVSAEDYAMGQARSALSMVGLGDVVDIATGVTQKVQGIMSDEEVRKGVEEVKRVVLDPDGRYSGAEIEKKLRELGVEVDHLKSELGDSLVGGLIGMA